jgi:hypothetical protein
MDVLPNVIATVASLLALVVAALNRKSSRTSELRKIGEDAVLIAKRKSGDGLPLERMALETAVLLDVQQDGKKDYTREQLWASVQAALARDSRVNK